MLGSELYLRSVLGDMNCCEYIGKEEVLDVGSSAGLRETS